MLPASILSPLWRVVTALLVAVAAASLPTYGIAVFVLPPIPPIVMARSFAIGTLLPAFTAWALRRVFGGTIAVDGDRLRIVRGDFVLEAPAAAVERVRPWRIPLPAPGLSLRLGPDGPSLGLDMRDPAGLVDLLRRAGGSPGVTDTHPALVYARTRRPWRPWATLAKFAGFGALPTAVLFYTHQHIAYGGTFGQYYLEGFAPYLATFAAYWTTVVVLLTSYAATWRAAAEAAVLLAAWQGATAARHVRRVTEAVCALAYYVGVPILLALRYRG